MDEIVGHMREKFVMLNSADIKIYPRRKPSKTIAEGDQRYELMEDLDQYC